MKDETAGVSLALLLVLGIAPVGPDAAQAQPPLAGRASATTERHVISGKEAWDEARRMGFEFSPVIPGKQFILSGRRDGMQVVLKACARAGGPCDAEAQVIEGDMVVLPPRCKDSCRRAHAFEMFAGRQLAPGWRVLGVEFDGELPTWKRRPRKGSRDMSFAVRIEAGAGSATTLRLDSITLEGPAGADWRRAFRSSRATDGP